MQGDKREDKALLAVEKNGSHTPLAKVCVRSTAKVWAQRLQFLILPMPWGTGGRLWPHLDPAGLVQTSLKPRGEVSLMHKPAPEPGFCTQYRLCCPPFGMLPGFRE